MRERSSSGGRVLQGESTTPPPKAMTATTRARAIWTVVLGLGSVLFLTGVVETTFGWFGIRLSDRNAFYNAVNVHGDHLTLLTLGAGAVAVGFMGRGSRKIVRALSWGFGGLALGHFLLFALYLGRIPPNLPDTVPVWRTLIWGLIHVTVYAWLSYYLWVQTRVQGWPSRPG